MYCEKCGVKIDNDSRKHLCEECKKKLNKPTETSKEDQSISENKPTIHGEKFIRFRRSIKDGELQEIVPQKWRIKYEAGKINTFYAKIHCVVCGSTLEYESGVSFCPKCREQSRLEAQAQREYWDLVRRNKPIFIVIIIIDIIALICWAVFPFDATKLPAAYLLVTVFQSLKYSKDYIFDFIFSMQGTIFIGIIISIFAAIQNAVKVERFTLFGILIIISCRIIYSFIYSQLQVSSYYKIPAQAIFKAFSTGFWVPVILLAVNSVISIILEKWKNVGE